MGAEFTFADNKLRLIETIRDFMAAKVPPLQIPDPLAPSDQRLSISVPKFISTQVEISDALADYIKRGLRLTFPTEDQWMITITKKQDSGSLRMPLVDIVRCARDLMVMK